MKMENTVINAPRGAEYVGQIEGFELPDGILAKGRPGCGATTWAITSPYKTIVCSPRNNLIINKSRQHPETLLVVEGVTRGIIEGYIRETEVPKILVSYDSFPRVAECIADKADWRVVVDEFQYLLLDSSFKSDVEVRLLESIEGFGHVTYLSATPIDEKYLQEIPRLRGVPYNEIVWDGLEKKRVLYVQMNSPLKAAVEIVRNYKEGHFPATVLDDGTRVESTECVIFLNSVKNIINIVKQTGLQPDEVNIVVGRSGENEDKVRKLGEGFRIGEIPLRGEPHKMFTFCTSTAFAGCDFYSPCASTFVVSDNNRSHTAIDIATDLVQIAGRQRLEENPFRNSLLFVYNRGSFFTPREELIDRFEEKKKATEEEVAMLNKITDEYLKNNYIDKLKAKQRVGNYEDTYTMYDDSRHCFAFNGMALLSEVYTCWIQQMYFRGNDVVHSLLEEKFDAKAGVLAKREDELEQLRHLVKTPPFAERMRQYCEIRGSGNPFAFTDFLERKYPLLRTYYEELGGERIKSLGYKEKSIRQEISDRLALVGLTPVLSAMFAGKILTSDEIRDGMNRLYAERGIGRRGTVEDLKRIYQLKVTLLKLPMPDGTRKNHYRVE